MIVASRLAGGSESRPRIAELIDRFAEADIVLEATLRETLPREADGAIPSDPEHMPDTISYHAANRRLWIGTGHIENVPPAVWAYEVSGKHVLTQWFSYRKRNRERPQIGDRRTPSPLGDIQPDRWRAEYTTELLNVLNVLGRLVALKSAQAGSARAGFSAGPTLTQEALRDGT